MFLSIFICGFILCLILSDSVVIINRIYSKYFYPRMSDIEIEPGIYAEVYVEFESEDGCYVVEDSSKSYYQCFTIERCVFRQKCDNKDNAVKISKKVANEIASYLDKRKINIGVFSDIINPSDNCYVPYCYKHKFNGIIRKEL